MEVSLIAGIILGLSAGLSPGPLLALVISQTLKHGVREGVKVALAPLITDAPIILLTFFVLTKLSRADFALGVISVAGLGVMGKLTVGSTFSSAQSRCGCHRLLQKIENEELRIENAPCVRLPP
jgi:threonine/homoserine/homoserine lactone efflux protein